MVLSATPATWDATLPTLRWPKQPLRHRAAHYAECRLRHHLMCVSLGAALSAQFVPNWTAASVCEAVLAEVNGAGRIHTCSSSLQGSLCHQGSFCTRFKLFPTEFLTRQSDAQPPSGHAFCTLTAAPTPCTAKARPRRNASPALQSQGMYRHYEKAYLHH